jgi:Protein of unknown function (DUF1499)
MGNNFYLYLIAAAAIVAVLIFVPFIRRVVGVLIRIGIALGAIGLAIFAIAVLMNDETIFAPPGVEARTIQFLSRNRAATSDKGFATATCKWPDEPSPMPTPAPTPVSAQAPAASPTPTPAPPEVFPELMTRGYPGIPRAKLFELATGTVNSLGGWKIVNSDPRAGTLDCIYTTRIFAWQDDVRITVTPRAEIQICSRSGTARPASTSLLRFFPGDFGANIGHIKQFYETLEPKVDAAYQEMQRRESQRPPRGAR